MMRLLLAAPLFPLFSLGSANSLAEQPPAPVALQPGQWELVTEMISVEAPGAPEPLLRQMRAQIAGHRETRSQCITPEQAGNAARTLIRSEPAGCRFDDTAWAGGAFRVRATCRPPGGAEVRLALDGSYAAQQINGRVAVHMAFPNPAGTGPSLPLDMQGRLTGRRTGDCRGQ